jgi:hypothetical protein
VMVPDALILLTIGDSAPIYNIEVHKTVNARISFLIVS